MISNPRFQDSWQRLRGLALLSISFRLVNLAPILVTLLVISAMRVRPAMTAGGLRVEIGAAPNLVVDSNVLSPSTYGPKVATVAVKFCNDSATSALNNVNAFIGDYKESAPANSTPGIYPARDSAEPAFIAEHPHLANTGLYSFAHLGGSRGMADASRYLGTLQPGECKTQYWHFTYPHTNPARTEPVWGQSSVPEDDLYLFFDSWAVAYDQEMSIPVSAYATHKMTHRNEISAMANKIKPNPDGVWFNTNSDMVQPGDTITSNGIDYELGVVNQGFDNDGDFVPDFNAWLQPVGDATYDPSCFRLIKTHGELYIKRGGLPTLVIPFEDQLYFSNLPQDNSGVTGRVYYTFMALNGPCSSSLTPYQEVASGYDNEKFNGDFGAAIPPVGSFEPKVSIDKSSDPLQVALGGTITYNIPINNSGTASAGLPLLNMPLTIQDSIPIPSGVSYKAGSAGFTGDVAATIQYSINNGATWVSTEPSPASSVTTLRWSLTEPLGAGQSGTATFQASLPLTPGPTSFIENSACASFGDGESLACDSTVTVVQGNNSLGDFVWQDHDGDGIQDTGEPGIGGIAVRLYWDKNGDKLLNAADIQIGSQNTSNGGYDFTQLPNGNYIVVVDETDTDLPVGYGLSSAGWYAVSLTGATDYNLADFGFKPALALDKRLLSTSPLYEGDLVSYSITLRNTLPGNGSGQPAACTYTTWAALQDSARSGTGNKAWTNPGNAANASGPDGLYATAPYANAGETLGLTSFNLGAQAGAITGVKVLLPIRVNPTLAGTLDVVLWANGVQVADARPVIDVSTLSTGILEVNVFPDRTWAWSDFSGSYMTIQLVGTKSGNPTGSLDVDGAAFQVTTEQSCGGSENTISYLPLTDTYNASLLEFVSASPAVSSAVTGGATPYSNTGTLTWADLGPLYAGGSKTISVTFRALQPPDTDADGESEPASLPNKASVTGATFPSGRPVNDAEDSTSDTLNPTGAIGDLVWNDINANRAYNPNGVDGIPGTIDDERGIPGVVLELRDGVCTPGSTCRTTTTDAGGWYLFTGLRDGSYTVAVRTISLPGGGSGVTNTFDKDGNFNNDSGTITINNSDNSANFNDDLTADFGYAVPAMIEGQVWRDWNNSATGAPDVGEEGLAGVTVYAYDGVCEYPPSAGGSADCRTAITDALGEYSITGLTPGAGGTTYSVVVVRSSGPLATGSWSQTYDEPNGPDGIPGTGDDAVLLDDQVGVRLVPGGLGNADYSYRLTGSATIGDILYKDWDGDGVQDLGSGTGLEPGIPNVTVWLYEDANGNGAMDTTTDALIATTTTDSGGIYSFPNLPTGSYLVVLDGNDPDLPASFRQTQDPDQAGVCTVCDKKSSITGVNGTSNYLDEDFGFLPTGYATIGDFVWSDSDRDGVQDAGEPGIANITVRLYADNNGDGVIDSGDSLAAVTVTAAGGGYTFANLPAGSYLVDVDTTDADLPLDGNLVRYGLSTANDPIQVILAEGQHYTDADFGFCPNGVIGDLIWRDNDRDGSPDPGEPAISGVTVELYTDTNQNGIHDTGEVLVQTDVTDANGLYEFLSVPSGYYIVVVTPPANHTLTGDPDELPPCTTCDNQSGLYLGPGRIDRSRDFGYAPPGVIGDTLWVDSDGDGQRDTTESGLSNVTVWLYNCVDAVCGDGNDVLQATTATDLDGYYSFGNLPDGGYQVRVDLADADLPADLAQTYDPDETNPCATCDGRGETLISSGNSNFDLDFGFQYQGVNRIAGTVFHDNDNNAVQDVGETYGYPGVTLYLWDANNRLVATATSAADGSYSFENLPDGVYTVSVNANAANLAGLDATITLLPTTYRVVDLDSGHAISDSAETLYQDFGFISGLDFGDLPDSYNLTLLGEEGPRHAAGALRLGTLIDSEPNGQPNATSAGDGADDDGVAPSPGVNWAVGASGGSVDFTVNGCSGVCAVNAWIDWNRDGDFSDAGEQIFNDLLVSDGSQTVPFAIPNGVSFGGVFNTRFRLYPASTGGTAAPSGMADLGEVEDYQWTFGPTAVKLSYLGARADTDSIALLLLFAALTLTTFSALRRLRRR